MSEIKRALEEVTRGIVDKDMLEEVASGVGFVEEGPAREFLITQLGVDYDELGKIVEPSVHQYLDMIFHRISQGENPVLPLGDALQGIASFYLMVGIKVQLNRAADPRTSPR